MPRKLDSLDLKILDDLGVYGSRNISDVARRLGIPNGTLRKRLKRLASNFYLRFNVNIYHTNLGLKKAVVFADANPGFENTVLDGLKANDFWIYITRYYGMYEGCLGIYTIPKDHCQKFEQFVKELRRSDAVKETALYWTTCFQTVQSRRKWFDENSGDWIFHWDEWIEEISSKSSELPHTLIDPKDFPIKGDEIDLFILKELEKDATKDLNDIAKMLGTYQQLIGYHYNKHVISRGLIESFNITFLQFNLKTSDMFFFVFRFDTKEKLAKFANSLMDKPFVRGLGKILGDNSLIALVYLPRHEFRRFIEALSELARRDYLQAYNYVIQDLSKTYRQTISYEHFKDGKWIYNHRKHIENLQKLVRNAFVETYT